MTIDYEISISKNNRTNIIVADNLGIFEFLKKDGLTQITLHQIDNVCYLVRFHVGGLIITTLNEYDTPKNRYDGVQFRYYKESLSSKSRKNILYVSRVKTIKKENSIETGRTIKCIALVEQRIKQLFVQNIYELYTKKLIDLIDDTAYQII